MIKKNVEELKVPKKDLENTVFSLEYKLFFTFKSLSYSAVVRCMAVSVTIIFGVLFE
jgi:hypothetical protein